MQTAYENFRQRYVGSKTPYDRGILTNFKEALFVAVPPPRVGFRAEVNSDRRTIAGSQMALGGLSETCY